MGSTRKASSAVLRTAFPGKSTRQLLQLQPAFKADLEAAAVRSGHSVQEVVHLIGRTACRVEDVTAQSFERYIKRTANGQK